MAPVGQEPDERAQRLNEMNRWQSGVVVALALALVLSGLVGCGDDPTASAGPGGEPAIRLATYEPAGSGGDGALLEGELADLAGCLVIEEPFGEHILPIWPSDQVSWSGDRLRLRGSLYALGDSIAVGGGFTQDEYGDIPQECRTLGLQMFIVSAG